MADLDQLAVQRLAALPVHLLSVHVDTPDPQTHETIAAAIERLADAIVDWHDAIVMGDPQHRGRGSVPRPTLAAVDAADAASTWAHVAAGGLEALCTACRVAASELATVGRQLSGLMADLDGAGLDRSARFALRERGEAIIEALGLLAESFDQYALVAAAERERLAGPDHDLGVLLPRSVSVLRRADLAVRHVAATTLPT